jgi:hypothetical protein
LRDAQKLLHNRRTAQAVTSATKLESKMNEHNDWIEYEVLGPVEVQRYRTNKNASIVHYWSPNRVPGIARQGWNLTRSASVALTAKQVLKTGQIVVDRR